MKPHLTTGPLPAEPIGPDSMALFGEHVARGAKSRESWAVGPELELFGYDRSTLERIGPETVEAVLRGFESLGATPVHEDGRVIEAAMEWGWLTVEPGGQIEFSGVRRRSLAAIANDVDRFLARLAELAEEHAIVFLAAGFDPLRGPSEQRWYPKRRYRVMRPYFSTGGRAGWDMMARTGAIQVNIDFDSEEDLSAKFIVGNRLGPVVAAMFANSPFDGGELSPFKSRRYAAWLATDTDRSGVSPAALADTVTIDDFVAYATRVPMLFVRRDGDYIDRAGDSFLEFLDGGAGDVTPVFQDFTDHLTTIFTEARVKQHVELRSADAGGPEWLMACLAFWKGLTYDAASLASAVALAPRLSSMGFRDLQTAIARDALGARAAGIDVLETARKLVRLAAEGLERTFPDERAYLAPLEEHTIERGECPADALVRDFQGPMHGDVRRLVDRLRVA
jgi:glutamate--cysteine ligase